MSFHCDLGTHTVMVQPKSIKTNIPQHSTKCHVSEVTLCVTAGVKPVNLDKIPELGHLH